MFKGVIYGKQVWCFFKTKASRKEFNAKTVIKIVIRQRVCRKQVGKRRGSSRYILAPKTFRNFGCF